eukprot:TRINITY_DN983_c0_g1_i1.p1 TRINITY_DN983_c0_g1~~TRINITY_DN983_c0_g1_i1.p1  ORF type:complete len:729 (-),score=216.86 TRINITY_DN983_c0_g1_i1:1377-3563(-)
MTFVQNVDGLVKDGDKKVRSRKMKKLKKDNVNEGEEWENARALPSGWKESKQSNKLPIKQHGKIIEAAVSDDESDEDEDRMEEDDEDDDDDDEGEGEDEDGDEEEMNDGPKKSKKDEYSQFKESVIKDYGLDDLAENDPELLQAKLYLKRQAHIQETKKRLAMLASEIQENPEQKIKKMNEFHEMFEKESDLTIKKYVILSEVAVFRDIVPGYRVRLPTDEELKMQVSKDVVQVRHFESGLLNVYQQYLGILDKLIKNAPKKDLTSKATGNTITAIAVKCVGKLLVGIPHFNFRANLIDLIVPLMDSKCREISSIARTSIRELFKQTGHSDAALEAAKKVSAFIKSKSYRVSSEVLRSFMYLPLNTALPEGTNVLLGITPKKKVMSKKEKKKQKEDAQLQKDLQEAAAEEDREEKRKIQTETLKVVFLIYFRILKKAAGSSLLPAVLEGLAKFSHLINIELLVDLLSVLREMISRQNLSVLSKLHCAVTAFQTLKEQGQFLNVDLKDFYTHLYVILFEILSITGSNDDVLPTILQCLQLMFTDTKQLSLDRVASFVKRLLTMCLYLEPHGAIAVMSTARGLLLKYPRTQQLLDNEFKGSGIYNEELEDPDHCNAFASTAWEFALLNQHPHSTLKTFSKLVCKLEALEKNYPAAQLYNFYKPNTESIEKANGKGLPYYYPSPPEPKQHIIEKKLQKYEKVRLHNIVIIPLHLKIHHNVMCGTNIDDRIP